MRLVGDRIELRDYVGDDWRAVASYQADPRYQTFIGPGEVSEDAARRLVDMFIAWAAEAPRRNYQLAIVERGSGVLLGSCGLRAGELPPGVAEFGLELSPEWWGRGIGGEASRLMLDFGFRTLELGEVRAESVSGNERIAGLLKKLGFAEAGSKPGEEWMREKGWGFVAWVLGKEGWEGAGSVGG
ncbi:GNAT family N-acetyltransferase [Polyangium aurulentum]|uniref:GNAT family N-acetyltransferase n=1 Tax=Polyangium aurulentum TaxID=2567896 RepID=UPI0010AEB484|nr:GNAT family N-acetyltransferase [Polyangium aurulentum]UQA55860.1 GNAT family N-acetyltransferase [Polyangium aurulentum]